MQFKVLVISSGGQSIPIALPEVIGPQGAQVEHGGGVVGDPPGAGQLQSFLHDIAMSALDFTGTDWQLGSERLGVVELAGPLGAAAAR